MEKKQHKQTVRSVTLELERAVIDAPILEAYLQRLLWEKDVTDAGGLPVDIFRMKVSGRRSAPISHLISPFRCGRSDCLMRDIRLGSLYSVLSSMRTNGFQC